MFRRPRSVHIYTVKSVEIAQGVRSFFSFPFYLNNGKGAKYRMIYFRKALDQIVFRE